jgi:hypothetical protein
VGVVQIAERKKIFISHFRNDKEIAKILKNHIEYLFNEKIKVFFSPDIPGGINWQESLLDN